MSQAFAPSARRVEENLPDPGNFWVRWVPEPWPGPERPWLDLARGAIRREQEKEKIWVERKGWAAGELDDLLYLPPVESEDSAARDELGLERLSAGTPVLFQVRVGDEAPRLEPAGTGPGALVVLDLLDPLLRGDVASCDRAPAGAVAAWPLLPGVTDDPALWEDGCARLAAAGVRQAQAVAVALTPQDRRWLAERRLDVAFEAVFHRQPPPERAFDRVAHRHGLAPFPPRPLPRGPRALRGNRRAAGALALAGELWLRLGRPSPQGEALYRAARRADRGDRDLEALAREGNLGLFDWLDPLGREVVEDLARTGRSRLVEALRIEYLAP